MAKTPAPPPPPPAPPAPSFTWGVGLAIPAARGFGGAKEGGIPGTDLFGAGGSLADMPVDASGLIEVTFPENMTDTAERDKHFEAEQKKIANRVTSTIRRFREYEAADKSTPYANYNFATRKVSDDTYGYGVRVWRIADTVTDATK